MARRVSRATYFKFCGNCGRVTPHKLAGFLGRGKWFFFCQNCGKTPKGAREVKQHD